MSYNNSKRITLKQGASGQPCKGEYIAFGRRGIVFLDKDRSVALIGPPAQLAATLREWANEIKRELNEPSTV